MATFLNYRIDESRGETQVTEGDLNKIFKGIYFFIYQNFKSGENASQPTGTPNIKQFSKLNRSKQSLKD